MSLAAPASASVSNLGGRILLALAITAVTAAAQPTTELKPRARIAPPLVSRELARKLAASIDAGDVCPSVDGPLRLRRVPGRVVVPLAAVTGAASPEQRWSAPGQPLSGYEVMARPAPGFAILSAPAAETSRQRQDPRRLNRTLIRARGLRSSQPVNPVFLDPRSGLELLATERMVITLQPGVDARRYFGRAWKQVRPVWGATDQYLLTLPGATAERVFAEAERRRRDPRVAWLEPDFIRQVVKSSTPNDPDFAGKQWNLQNTGQTGRAGSDAKLAAAWDLTIGNPDIVVAILDDGVQISHPDLAPNLYLNTGETPNNGVDDDQNGLVDDFHGYDFFAGRSDPSPSDVNDSHGTAVAGIAVAAGNNAQGIAGAAYGCRVLPLKIVEGEYLVADSILAAVLRYAAGFNSSGVRTWRGADVLNMSLLFGASFVVNNALTDAATRGRNGLGCGIFVAAGNSAAAWSPYELTLTQGRTYTLRWEYTKDATKADGDDTVWLDGITFPDGTTESFQSGGLPAGWTSGGPAPWSNVLEGVNGNRALVGWSGPASRSLRAGAIGGNQTSWVEVTKTLDAGVLRFWVWTSTERDYDFFVFRVDGEEIFSDSGVPLPDTIVGYPASHAACFAVGASTDFDYRADYSQYGLALDFLAPSDGGASTIYTTDRTGANGYNMNISPGGDYAPDFGGTSAATPLAAGVAALVYSANPYLTSGDLRALLRSTCDRIGGVTYDAAGRNHFYGSGRINAARAVSEARVDLRVIVAPPAPFANVGDASVYTVTVQNLGPARSGPLTLTNQLPAGTVFGASTPSASSRSGARVVFSIASLAPAASATVLVRLTNQVAGTNLFLAGVTGGALESAPENNTHAAQQIVYPIPTVSIQDTAVVEGNSGTTNAVFGVTLSNPSVGSVTMTFATTTNTATAGADYTTTRGTLTFAPGETNRTIAVRVLGDARNEGDDSFLVTLTNVVRANLGRAQAAGLILNDDPLPSLSISNVVVTEGNSGARKATFKVSLRPVSGRVVTVDYATASGSAMMGTDFIGTNGTLTFAAGKTSQKVVVPVLGDAVQESNLTFTVNLSNPINASLAQAQGIGTIRNNDKPPRVFVEDVDVTEGDGAETNAMFRVRLSAASGLLVSMAFTTTNGSAAAGTDYVGTNGIVTFAPGQTNQDLAIRVLGDLLSESKETFSVRLEHLTNVVAGDSLGLAAVHDNDPLPQISVQDPLPITEPISGTTNLMFDVFLSTSSGRTVVVKYDTANGSAAAGADFVARSGSLVFPPGTSNRLVEVPVRADALTEESETFSLVLSAPVNVQLGVASAAGTILDRAAPALARPVLDGPTTTGPTLAVSWMDGVLRLHFVVVTGERYVVEQTEDLAAGSWEPLTGSTEIIGTGLEIIVADDQAVLGQQRFYRLRRLE